MSEIKKLSPEDLKKLQDLQSKYSEISFNLGQLKVEQLILNQQADRLKQLEETYIQSYYTVQQEEETLASEISKKYGQGQINIETGEITPSV